MHLMSYHHVCRCTCDVESIPSQGRCLWGEKTKNQPIFFWQPTKKYFKMMNWAKQQSVFLLFHLNHYWLISPRLANVAGTQEPVYGPSAIQSVAEQAKTTPYAELSKADLKWTAMESTCVETQVFYLMAETGHIAIVQLIYSNVAYVDNFPWPDLWLTIPKRSSYDLPIYLQGFLSQRFETIPVVLGSTQRRRLQRRQDQLLCRKYCSRAVWRWNFLQYQVHDKPAVDCPNYSYQNCPWVSLRKGRKDILRYRPIGSMGFHAPCVLA